MELDDHSEFPSVDPLDPLDRPVRCRDSFQEFKRQIARHAEYARDPRGPRGFLAEHGELLQLRGGQRRRFGEKPTDGLLTCVVQHRSFPIVAF